MNSSHPSHPSPSGALILLMLCVVVGCGSAQRNASDEDEEPGLSLDTEELPQDAHGFTLPFELIDNRIFFDVFLGEETSPFRFVLDTGATTVIDLAVMQQLGIDDEEETVETGAGEAQVQAFRAWLRNLRIGEARFRALFVTVIDLSEVRDGIGFERLDGIIGLELLQQYVVTIDYPSRTLAFREAARFQMETARSVTVVPFELHHHIPTVEGSISGRPTRLWIDIGDRSNLTLTTPFIEQHELRSSPTVGTERTTGWGVGGPIKAQLTRVESLQLGELRFEDVMTRLPTSRAGAFTSDSVGGSVGNGLLRSRNMTIDYARRRLLFGEPISDPASGDRAGLWILRRDGHVTVEDVLPGGPADEAGIQGGDRIVAALDRVGDSLSIIALREALADPERNQIEIQVARGGNAAQRLTIRLDRPNEPAATEPSP